jgi:hypothetical protein
MVRHALWTTLSIAVVLAAAATAKSCPFCSAVSQTFSEEIGTMDVAVIATLVKVPPPSDKPGDEIQKATFEVAKVLKGDGLVKVGEKFDTLYFGDGSTGKSFLVMGISPPKIMWSTPLPLTERGIKYLGEILTLPKEGPERLVFFQKYLEDEDEMLARDAYDEFARAPYAQVKALKDQIDLEQVVAWIKNPEIPASRRRLYLVMLGVAGDETNLPMLEEFMKSTDRKSKSGLDALIACYLTLKGETGLPLIEELFLANQKADYADTYAAIMAIRFHGTDGGVIDPKRLVVSLHHMLERPELADLVIPDLAKWEDWAAMDRLVDLYKTADEKNSWVRVPVINYLRACPLPKAKELLKECEKIDPAAVKRANTFFPVSPAAAPAPPADKATQNDADAKLREEMGDEYPVETAVASSLPTGISATLASAQAVAAQPAAPGEEPAATGDDDVVVAVNRGADPAAAAAAKSKSPPNLAAILGVSWAIGLVLLAVQWTVLRGRS